MRVGLFGGTFNPIHNGHLMVARRALAHVSLDRLYIVPCRTPPHKSPAYLAPAAHRLRMIELALPDDGRLRLSTVEIDRRGPSYTIDTVTRFARQITPEAALFLIMGMDAFLEIHTWKAYRRLLAVVQPVVVSRSVDDAPANDGESQRLSAYIRSRLGADYRFDENRQCWHRADRPAIHLLSVDPVEVSSSAVRRRLGQGKSVAALVPAAVSAYIEQEDLYR